MASSSHCTFPQLIAATSAVPFNSFPHPCCPCAQFGTAHLPEFECAAGTHLLFTAHRIRQTHLLLFAVAVVHIVYTSVSLYTTIYRVRSCVTLKATA